MRTLIRAHTMLTQTPGQPELRDSGLVVEDGVIQRVGPLAELERQGQYDAVVGDSARHLALPGLINAHHHAFTAGKTALPASFLETWIVRSRGRHLPPPTAEEVYDHTLWGALQCLKAGVTGLLDHHRPAGAHLEDSGVPAALRAYLDAGLRSAVCLACADQPRIVYGDEAAFLAGLPPALADAVRQGQRPFDAEGFFALWKRLHAEWDGRDGRLRIGLAPSGPEWCTDALLQQVRRVADAHGGVPVQIHLVESPMQAVSAHRGHGKSAAARLNDLGFFGPATSCAHCVWVSREDAGILAATGAVAVHNPASNLILFNGIAPVADLLAAGARVAFGMDARDLDDEMDYLTDLRLGLLLQRRPDWHGPVVTAADMLALATRGGAQALGQGATLGRLEAGYQADVILLDRSRLYDSPYVSPATSAAEVLLQRGKRSDVEHVLVAGRLAVEAGRVCQVDEESVRQRLLARRDATCAALDGADALADLLEPHLIAYYQGWQADGDALLPSNYRLNTR